MQSISFRADKIVAAKNSVLTFFGHLEPRSLDLMRAEIGKTTTRPERIFSRFQTEKRRLTRHGGADFWGVFADSGGEDEGE